MSIYTTSPFRETPQLKSAEDFSPRFRRWDRRACEIDERVRPIPGEYVRYARFADVVGIEEVEDYLRALRIPCGGSGHGEA